MIAVLIAVPSIILALILARGVVNHRRWLRKMKAAGDAVARRNASH